MRKTLLSGNNIRMAYIQIDSSVIEGINNGDEACFKKLYDLYFSYLCACATIYVIDTGKSQEIVNDLFMNVWNRRGFLEYPIHSYLIQGIRNGCLNYLRSLTSERNQLEKYTEELLTFQEEYCLNDQTPLEYIEIEELKKQINKAIGTLPEKCRNIFIKYLYEDKSPKEIAQEDNLSVNTVRVQIKIAFDKLRIQLGPSLLILFLMWK